MPEGSHQVDLLLLFCSFIQPCFQVLHFSLQLHAGNTRRAHERR